MKQCHSVSLKQLVVLVTVIAVLFTVMKHVKEVWLSGLSLRVKQISAQKISTFRCANHLHSH